MGTGPLTTTPSKATLTNEFRSSIVGGLEFDGIASEFLFTNKGIIGLQVGSELNYAVQLYVEPSAVNYASSGDPDVPANTSVIQNAGKIFGGLSGEFLTLDLSVENSGSITPIKRDPYADAVNLSVLGHGEEGELDAASASFANSGVVTGTVTLDLQASSVSVTNSGHISQDLSTSSPSSYVSAKSGLQVYQHTSLGADLSLVNTGTISSDDYAGVAVLVGIGAGDDWADMPGSQQATAHASITNSGTIIARGGQAVDFGFDPALDNSVALAVGLDARGQTSVDIHNEAGGIIRNEPGPFIIFSHIGPDPVAGMAIAAGADTVTLVNDGEISGAQSTVIGADLGLGVAVGKSLIPQNVLENVIGGAIDTFDSNDIITNSATGVIKGGIALRHGNDGFTNAGTVSGDVYMGTGNDVLFNTGLIDGNVDMGDGDDTFGILLAHAAPGGTKGITGTLDGGAGNDLLVFDVTGGGALEDMAKLHHTGFETTAIGGTGTVTANNLVLSAPIGLASGFVTLASGSSVSASTPGGAVFQGIAGVSQDLINQGSITGAISLGDETDSLTNYGTVNGNVDFGSGDDFFVQGINASLTGTADGGDGYDTFTLDITGGGTIRSALYNRIVNFELLGLTGSGTIVADGPLHFDTIGLMANTPITFGAGTTIQTDSEAAVTGSTGNDQLTNDGTINGDVNLGNGDDQYTNNGTMNGDVGAGLGDDHVTNNGTINGDVDLDGVGAPDGDGGGGNQQQQFARAFALAAVVVPTGGDDVLDNPGFIGGSVFAGAGNDQFTNSGTVGGDVYMGTGNDHFTLSGGVNGLIDLGDDNDVLELRDGWSIGGLGVLAGTGTDELRIATTSTYAEPTEIGLGQFGGFETVAVQSGVTAFSGNGAFDSIHVAGGRLIGRTGSEIDADVTVDQGATFGSAGLVRGDIVVNGTLSPGASPGTMTVVGDVQLGAGSSTVFEFTPSASDALVIDGTLTIASGASLTLSGTRPLTPGSYVLIDTTGGIHGTFGTNITRDDTILGVLRQTEDTLELISMFQLTSGANGQVTLTNAYLNALLTGGTATDGVLDAFPVLVGGDGFANQAVLATLNPEAYASVAQIGFENGQAIASALRGARVAGPDTGSGLFVFGQGFGAWRRFAGQDNGVSRANVRTGGYLGGVGFGNDVFGAALFVGRSDARQSIPGIAARNEADGMFFGGRVNVSAGGFDAGASLILDRAKADTTRNPATGVSKTNSHYDLHSTTLDGWVGYGFELGQGMKIGPQVGVTHTEVKRKGVTETGGGAFALQVAGQKYKLTTLTADIRASGPVSGKLRGWIEGGVRHRIDGDPITATAAFTGTGTSFTVNGASRAKTTAHFGAGAELTVAKNVDLFVNGDAEAKGGNGANRIDGGVRIRF
ncbi:autotransporter domain-containing protein [Novosphingobium colocasiae]|uniref:autotransporter domain-containing protein n=1 Tax=Novosphingobium colocasiae TaxID=1256513 RepID=UPI0035AF18C9